MQMRKVNHEKDYYKLQYICIVFFLKLLDDKVFGLHHEFKHVKFLKHFIKEKGKVFLVHCGVALRTFQENL